MYLFGPHTPNIPAATAPKPLAAPQETKHDKARDLLFGRSPLELGEPLQRANMAALYQGQTPLDALEIRKVVERAQRRYEDKAAAEPGHIEIIKAFGERFGRDASNVVSRFLHEVRKESFQKLKEQEAQPVVDVTRAAEIQGTPIRAVLAAAKGMDFRA